MSAEWDCQEHGTTNIGQCPACEIQEAFHRDCNARCEKLESELATAKAALQSAKGYIIRRQHIGPEAETIIEEISKALAAEALGK